MTMEKENIFALEMKMSNRRQPLIGNGVWLYLALGQMSSVHRPVLVHCNGHVRHHDRSISFCSPHNIEIELANDCCWMLLLFFFFLQNTLNKLLHFLFFFFVATVRKSDKPRKTRMILKIWNVFSIYWVWLARGLLLLCDRESIHMLK